jgi:hypothetical protein
MKSRICAIFTVILAFSLLSIIAPDSFSQTKVSIPDIAGKTPKEVAKILGAPTAKEVVNPSRTRCPCDKLIYNNGQIEIVFIKGRADWITVNNMNDAAYNKNSLTLLGIAVRDPDTSNPSVMRWSKLNGLQEVSFFPSGQKIFYVYIKAFTP